MFASVQISATNEKFEHTVKEIIGTFEVLVKDVTAHGDDRSHDELDEASVGDFVVFTRISFA